MTTPSERRAMLLKALDYAHEAVNLDTTKDGRGAVVAYRKCTALLDEVIVAAAPLDEKSTTKQSLSDVRHWHDRYAKRAERLMQKYKISPLSIEVVSSA
ncbi:hypothetical protein CCMSSC00406_0000317 [Pleurotus cornucopiae]|uniref:Uncharacterized protein n=1 Tax=Pleurotus cornucopiae TaxID=5321 RepID=A0ACB7IZ32_PLECO|nr:hypothetical protein CCMSSC00406_0000317 [Pleurotus cornucopiae]